MSTPRFFVEHLHGSPIRLSDAEARHAIRVRRLRIGDAVSLFDAAGRQATGVIAAVSRDHVEVAVTEISAAVVPRGPRLVLAVAIPKGPRAEWLIEKSVELGVHAIWPMTTQRSIVTPRDAKLDKWRRIAREANKQSGRPDTMHIEPVQTLEAILARAAEFNQRWLADIAAPASQAAPFAAAPQPADSPPDQILIGPEGGWTDAERASILASGAQPIRLAAHILRIETAALTAAAQWSVIGQHATRTCDSA